MRLAEGREVVGDTEEEDDADDAAIGRAGPCDGVVEAGVVSGGAKGSAHGGGHEGVHGDEAGGEGDQAHDAAGCSTEIGGEEKEGELAGGFSANAVEHADEEDGFSGVHPLETVRLGGLMVPKAADLPGDPEDAVDGDGETALNARVGVAVGVFAEDAGDDADAEDDEGEADEALGPVVEALRQAEVHLKDENAEGGDREGVAEGVSHA